MVTVYVLAIPSRNRPSFRRDKDVGLVDLATDWPSLTRQELDAIEKTRETLAEGRIALANALELEVIPIFPIG